MNVETILRVNQKLKHKAVMYNLVQVCCFLNSPFENSNMTGQMKEQELRL